MADRRVKVVVEAEIGNYRKGMEDAGRATEGLAKSTDKLGPATDKATGRFGKLSAAVSKHSGDMDKVGTSLIGVGAGLTAMAVGAGKAAMDWESAWAGVMKTNDGTAEQTQQLEQDLRNLTSVLPATHGEIAATAEAAGQLGVSIDDVAGFSEVMLNLGETTNLSADEAATALARFSNIMGTSFDDAERLGSTIVGLGNNFATTEAEIVAMSMRIAGVGRQMGLTEADVLAMSTAMSSVGIEAEAGGTAISMVMKKIDSSVREGGESLTGWAEAAGVTAQEFATAWSEDPAQAMVLLTENLGAVGAAGGDINAILADLGVKGIREADTILRLAGASGTLSAALEEGASAWEQNIALADEAAVRYETTESKIAIAWNQIKDAAIDAGGALLPIVATVAEGAAGIAQAFAGLPEPVKTALGVLGGVGGIALLGAGGMLKLAPAAFETVTAFQNLAKAAPGAVGGLKTFGKVAGGLTVGVAAAAGLVTALTTLYNSARDATPEVEDLANALLKLSESGDMTSIDEMFSFEGVITDVNGFADAVAHMDLDNPIKHIQSFGDTVFKQENAMSQMRDTAVKLDQTLAVMDADSAAQQVDRLRQALELEGDDSLSHWNNLKEMFPEYAASVTEAANATYGAVEDTDLLSLALGDIPSHLQATGDAGDEAAGGVDAAGESMEESAEAAEELADAVKDALDGLREMGVVPRNAQAANDAYQASLDALTESLKENGKTLDDTTDKGRNNRQAMRDHADAALENVAAMAESGASQEELQGQLTSTYAELVKAGEGFGLSSAAADLLARDMLAIPENVDIETWMSESAANVAQYTYDQIELIPDSVQIIADMSEGALNKAFETAAAIEVIPGYKRVDVAVDDQGTPGQVQSRVNAITGKTEYVFVKDDGTSQYVQQQILNIDGKDVPVYVKDDGTVVVTQGKINGVHGKDVRIGVHADTSAAEAAINLAARARSAVINVTRRVMGQAALAEGGIAGFGNLPKYSNGGRLPSYGRGTDTILGVGSDGVATAWVDDGEFVTRRASTQKYFGVLDRINRDDPSVRHLAGYAGGGSVGREWSAMSMASAASSSPVSATVDASVIASAVSSAMAGWTPMVNVAGREFHGVMKQLDQQYGGR